MKKNLHEIIFSPLVASIIIKNAESAFAGKIRHKNKNRMIDNCYNNGYAISCLKYHEIAKNWETCEEKCVKSNAFKLIHPFSIKDYYNFGLVLNETKFLSSGAENNSDQNGMNQYCTNLKYDFGKSQWTDVEKTVDTNFIEEWRQRFGDFWNNYPHGHPIQPYEPVKSFLPSEYSGSIR